MEYQAIHPRLKIFKYTSYIRYIKLVASIALFIGVSYQSSNYYDFLRVTVFISSIYALYEHKLRYNIMQFNSFSKKADRGILIILFGIIALLFNPIIPIYILDKSYWGIIDVFAVIVFIVSFISYSRKDSTRFFYWDSVLIIYDLELKYRLTVNNLISFAENMELDVVKDEDYSAHKLNTIYFLYSKAIELEPLNPKQYFRRGLLKLKYSNEFVGSSINDLQNAIKLGEENKYVNLYIGIIMLLETTSWPSYKGFNSEEKRLLQETREDLLSSALELFRKQIQINNSPVAYFFIYATWRFIQDKRKKMKILILKI